MPAVAGVTVQRAMIQSFQDTIAELLGMFTSVLVTLASIIAIAMVYNGARIALSERGRELASLRVLGFTREEVSTLLLGEQALVTVPRDSARLGDRVRRLRAALGSLRHRPDADALVATPRSYIIAALTVAAATIASGMIVRRRINRMDLVAVLKTRE